MLSSYSVEKMFDMSLSICCVILVLLHCMWLNLRGHHSLDLSSASSSFTPPTCEPRPHHSFLCLYFDPLVLQLCVSPCFNIYQTSSLHKSKPAQSHLSTFSLNSLIQVSVMRWVLIIHLSICLQLRLLSFHLQHYLQPICSEGLM